jgi:type VI secretion system protein ImpA
VIAPASAVNRLVAPLDGLEPCGVDLRYDPVFDEISEALRHDDGAAQGEWVEARKRADYPRAVRLATDVLSTRSKDIRVAAFLTEALVRVEGFRGLARGLDVLRVLVDESWEHVHPLPDDGSFDVRAAPLERIGTWDPFLAAVRDVALTADGYGLDTYDASRRLGYEAAADSPAKVKSRLKLIADGVLTPEKFDAAFARSSRAWYEAASRELVDAQRNIATLEAAVGRRFPVDSLPSFHALRGALEAVSRVLMTLRDRKRELEPGPIEPNATDATFDSDLMSGDAATQTHVTDAASASRSIVDAVRIWQQTAPHDPVPYAVVRTLRWAELAPRGDLLATAMDAPPGAVRAELRQLFLARRWVELLQSAERAAGESWGRAWLDAHRYVVVACDALGPTYGAVSAVVEQLLRAQLVSTPLLADAALLDDTPAASTETRAWLAMMLPASVIDGGAARAISADPDALERATAEARAGRPDRAVALLMAAIGTAESARQRFFSRTRMARIMVDAGQHVVALPILRDLIRLIEAHNLSDWETSAAIAEPMSLSYRALSALDQEPAERERLYQRLCLLDAVSAMSLARANAA